MPPSITLDRLPLASFLSGGGTPLADVVAVAVAIVTFALPVLGNRPDRPDMSGADLFGLIVSTLVCVYLVYALVRGEKL